jgi:mono/diheme cytochrome c family protein
MKKNIPALVLLLLGATIYYSCQNASSLPATASGVVDNDSLIKRGSYLVTAMGCNDCHTAKRMGPNGPELDTNHLLSGFTATDPLPKLPVDTAITNHYVLASFAFTSFVGPWGTSFAANLTSDPTGLGGWTLERFKKALQEGQYHGIDGTRKILPPMPLTAFKDLNDDDFKALYTYLQATKPVKNLVPKPIPPGGMAIK